MDLITSPFLCAGGLCLAGKDSACAVLCAQPLLPCAVALLLLLLDTRTISDRAAL